MDVTLRAKHTQHATENSMTQGEEITKSKSVGVARSTEASEASQQTGWAQSSFVCLDGSETGGRIASCPGSIPPRTFPQTCPPPDLESGQKTRQGEKKQ